MKFRKRRVRESHSTAAIQVDPTGHEWDVVIIRKGLSVNGNFYDKSVLLDSAPLFEGVKACVYRYGKDFGSEFNHVIEPISTSKFVGNVVGFYRNVRYGEYIDPVTGKKEEGLLGKLRIFQAHSWLARMLKEAFQAGAKGLLGLSIDAEASVERSKIGTAIVNVVRRIFKVNSTDFVTEPSAGGGLLRITASKGVYMNFLKLLEARRGSWVKRVERTEGQKDTEYSVVILESVVEEVKRLVEATDPGSEMMPALGRGMATLFRAMAFLQEGKDMEAAACLSPWLEAHPDSENMRESAQYPYPVKESKKETKKTKESKAKPPREIPRVMLNLRPRQEDDQEEAEEDTSGVSDVIENALSRLQESEARLAAREARMMVREALSNSGLPKQAQARVLRTFEGKADIEDAALERVIQEERDYIQTLVPTTGPAGLGGAHGGDTRSRVIEHTAEEVDRYGKAWEGFFAGRDVDGVTRFYSLQEAFGKITKGRSWGSHEDNSRRIFEMIALALPRNLMENSATFNEHDQHFNKIRESAGWGRTASRFLREGVTSSEFTTSFGQALMRRLQKRYMTEGRREWRDIISSIENLKDLTNSFSISRIGQIGTLPTVNEKAAYQDLVANPTEVTETMTGVKKGGLYLLTFESVLADSVNFVRTIPVMLADAANLTISENVWNHLEANTAIQGNALISSANLNLVASNPALDYDGVVDAIQLMREQTDQDSGKRLGLVPRFLITGPEQEALAWEITASQFKATSTEDSTISNFVAKRQIIPISVLDLGLTDTTDTYWWLAADPASTDTIAIGFLGGRDRPDIFVQDDRSPNAGEVFDADVIRFKIRLGFQSKLVDWRGFVGSLNT